MRLDSLVHLSKAVMAMAEADRVVVFGSASLLASFPELGEQEGSPFLQTYDADLIPFPFEEEVGRMLDEAFGEDRVFHQRFGYHADIVRDMVVETFPAKWEERLVPLKNVEGVVCLDPHDMAAVKCLIGREKDRIQLQFLLSAGLLDAAVVKERLTEIAMTEKQIRSSYAFLAGLGS
jgi:hypothetical protein